jgi:undecaprenyl diphosphate synthase
MNELITDFLDEAGSRMAKSVESTRNEFATVRTGRASPHLLDRIEVAYYGTRTPLNQLSQVSASEARLLTITPYDKSSIKAIEKAILESDVGLTPNNDGNVIRLTIPELTEERRRELVKIVHNIAEQGRVAVRNIRRDVMHDLRELKNEGEVGSDDEHRAESELQKLTDARVGEIGNGRWAQARGLPVLAGHQAGADTVKARLRDAAELGVKELTVYSFSTENWTRPRAEVEGLMAMFAERIDRETPELHEEGVRMRFVGRRDGLDAALQRRMDWAEELTAQNERITLFVAFNYGGRAEIVDAARTFSGETEEDFRRHLYAPDMHDPDLLIRTSGEQRISNYLLWQLAYSEFVFRDELWPDFSREAFIESLDEFSARGRRFGAR